MKRWLGRLVYDFVGKYLIHLDPTHYSELLRHVAIIRRGNNLVSIEDAWASYKVFFGISNQQPWCS